MFRFCLICLLLAACASPSPRFMGATRTEVTVNDMQFTVFQRASEVEVYRTGLRSVPRQRDVFGNAIVAIEQATGCPLRPKSMTGDAALIRASVDCPAAT